MKTEKVHISIIKIGDTIIFNNEMKTISGNNLKHDSFMGITLFGDSFKLGYQPVTKVTFN